MTTRKQQQTEESIADDTSIPQSVRIILAECPKQELRPVRFHNWVDKLVSESRRKGVGNKKIAYWIVTYAHANYWSDAQIDAALTDHKLLSSSSGSFGGGNSIHTFVIEDVEHLTQWITGLNEIELQRTERREDMERKSRSHILETHVRLSEYEINHWIAQFAKLGMTVDICLDDLRRRKVELKRSMITE